MVRDALGDARVLVDGAGTTAGVVNRLYYAAFHAARAARYANGENPTSHGHVRQLFGQRLVLEGDATRARGRLLGDLYDYRLEADYDGGEPDLNGERLLGDVEAFVDGMAAIVEDADTDGRTSLRSGRSSR